MYFVFQCILGFLSAEGLWSFIKKYRHRHKKWDFDCPHCDFKMDSTNKDILAKVILNHNKMLHRVN